jgi:hypothetical protein
MSLPLPKPIEVFMSSENTHDTDALAECFASDATVQDEGQTLKGLKAIKSQHPRATARPSSARNSPETFPEAR